MPLRAGRARATRIPSGIAVTPELLNERVNDVLVVGAVASVCVSTIISVRSVQRTRFLIEWQQAVSKTHSRPALTPSSTRANPFVPPKRLQPTEQTEQALAIAFACYVCVASQEINNKLTWVKGAVFFYRFNSSQ